MSLSTVWAQSPNSMSYQAVVRDASNALVTSQDVGVQISILQGSATGTAVYVETQTPESNANGLISLAIGNGTDFATIDWSNGPFFIQTETDPTGGTNYTITGTSQLLSVPYALHANVTDSIAGGIGVVTLDSTDIAGLGFITEDTDTQLDSTDIVNLGFVAGGNSSSSNPFFLGQDTLGGIVYYIYIGADGQQHGLIVNRNESTAQWQSTTSLTGADRTEDGTFNTNLMTSSPAADYVNGLSDDGFIDWYLPSTDELGLLYYNRFTTTKLYEQVAILC